MHNQNLRVHVPDELPIAHVLFEEYQAIHGVAPDADIRGDDASGLRSFYQFVHKESLLDDEHRDAAAGDDPDEHYTKNRRERAALCLSGGGIRSATFNLGILQELARLKLLPKFEYLSTVSGGGYIGSWLSAWMHRAGGVNGVARELSQTPKSPLDPEPRPIRHLRDYSNYMSPKLGLLSADSWTLAAVYLRNLLLNWLVMIPLAGAFLALPRVVLGFQVSTLSDYHGWMAPLLGGIGSLLAVAALAYRDNYQPSSRQDEDAASNTNGQFLRWFLLPMTVAAFFFASAWASAGEAIIVVVGIWWIPPAFCALLSLLAWTADLKKFMGGGRSMFNALQGVVISGSVAGFCLWLIFNEIFPHPYAHPVLYASLAPPMFLISFLLGSVVWAGYTSRVASNADLEWWARDGAWVLIVVVIWPVVSLLVLAGPALLLQFDGTLSQLLISALLPVSGGVAALLGKSGDTPANGDEAKKLGSSALLHQYGLMLAAPIFIVMLAIAISYLTDTFLYLDFGVGSARFPTDQWQHYDVLHATGAITAAWTALFFFIVGWAASHFVDVNKFSLHQTYRNRLVRAYLGASNFDRLEKCDQFTGFDEDDNLPMYKLVHAGGRAQRPFHVLNIALNLVDGEKLSWQQRKAESFTVSALHSGCHTLKYRRSRAYPGGLDHGSRKKNGGEIPEAITLGTALAISGAAASPNQGYHSSPVIGLIMTFFNVRLGAWLNNPAFMSKHGLDAKRPGNSIKPIIDEALGLTDDKSSHVYLSDGGHFENLGIYEMVLRRCRYIVVSDAGHDPECTFEDLGNAIRKIRIDLGVPIELSTTTILPRSKNKPGAYCAVGKIQYACVDGDDALDGVIIYLKPAFYGNEPTDVYNYGQQYPDFPHESTLDQFFSESQFESYRALGAFLLHRVWGKTEDEEIPRDLKHFAQRAGAAPLTSHATQPDEK